MAEASRESHGDKYGTGCQTERSEPRKKPGRQTTEAIRRTTDRAPEGDGGRETGRHGDKQGRLQTNLARPRAFQRREQANNASGHSEARRERRPEQQAGAAARSGQNGDGQREPAGPTGAQPPKAGREAGRFLARLCARRSGGEGLCRWRNGAEPEGTVPGRYPVGWAEPEPQYAQGRDGPAAHSSEACRGPGRPGLARTKPLGWEQKFDNKLRKWSPATPAAISILQKPEK